MSVTVYSRLDELLRQRDMTVRDLSGWATEDRRRTVNV